MRPNGSFGPNAPGICALEMDAVPKCIQMDRPLWHFIWNGGFHVEWVRISYGMGAFQMRWIRGGGISYGLICKGAIACEMP